MGGLEGLALPILLFAGLYFVLIRPQQKRQRQHRDMVSSVSLGDDVVTIGGLHGEVVDLSDSWMDLDVSGDKSTILRFERSSIARVVRDEDDADAAADADDADETET